MVGPPIPLACVLECSSIAAMAYLSVLVVMTRVGVNKNLPDKDRPPAPATRRPAAPPPVAAPPRPATRGELALMVGVVVGMIGGTLAIALILTRWM
jgi:hypothetical protein